MNIVVLEELKAYIDPLTPDEHDALERSLLAEGCRDALVLWGDVLVDGHNRYGICQKHGLPFHTVQNPNFRSMEDVHLWMIDQHLGRRSLSDFQRGVLALRKREIVAERRARAQAEKAAEPVPEAPTGGAPWEGDAPAAALAAVRRGDVLCTPSLMYKTANAALRLAPRWLVRSATGPGLSARAILDRSPHDQRHPPRPPRRPGA